MRIVNPVKMLRATYSTGSLLTILLFLSLIATNRPDLAQTLTSDFRLDSIRSALDGNVQRFYYYRSTAPVKQPLVVVLHQWSAGYQATEFTLRQQAKAKNWHYVFPDFRGANNHPKACCSDYVIRDLDEVIDWAVQSLNVDEKRIHIVGVSGGGYATLCAFMKAKRPISSFSAWVPITDLESWYHESLARKTKYAGDILRCTGADADTLDGVKARARSPMYWQTPVRKLSATKLRLFAGIHDGYTGRYQSPTRCCSTTNSCAICTCATRAGTLLIGS